MTTSICFSHQNKTIFAPMWAQSPESHENTILGEMRKVKRFACYQVLCQKARDAAWPGLRKNY